MIIHWRKIFFTLLLSLTLIAVFCSERGNDDLTEKLKPYSIFLGEFKTRDQIETFRLSLNSVLYDKLRIEKIYDRNYKLFYGRYPSSFEAGQEAFELYTKSLIAKNYKITRDSKRILDSYANVLFVSKYLNRPSVFSFNIITNQIEVEWSNPLMKVVALNYGPDHSTAFISAALSSGRRGGVSYINDAALYLMKREEERTLELEKMGDGIQLYTYWENKDTFKVNYSSVDSIDAKTVVQKIYPFNINGKRGVVKERRFDLLKSGFPFPPKRSPSVISPNNRFRFRAVYSQGESYIYLRDFDEKSEQLTSTIYGKLTDARWSEDGNFLFIVINKSGPVQNENASKAGELLIIDAVQKKPVRIFSGFSYENLLVHGKLLFFDKRSEDISQIEIYDYRRDKIIQTISMYTGCGLNNLP
ncbi:MAG: hypothetical protein WC061_04550 [Melioribacteraceae bacterium]